jgi:hypothetical protein
VSSIRSVVLSISGCNIPAHQLRMCDWLSELFPNSWSTLPNAPVASPPAAAAGGLEHSTLVHAYNDSIAALVSGTDGARLEGVVLIAGTGMICKGFTTGGKEQWTTGGNGALIDKGSGFSIGIAVAHAAFKAFDGMGPPTPLLKATLDFLKIEHAPEIVDWYAHACTRGRINQQPGIEAMCPHSIILLILLSHSLCVLSSSAGCTPI